MKPKGQARRKWQTRLAAGGVGICGFLVLCSVIGQAIGILPTSEELDQTRTLEAVAAIAQQQTDIALTPSNTSTSTATSTQTPTEAPRPTNTPVNDAATLRAVFSVTLTGIAAEAQAEDAANDSIATATTIVLTVNAGQTLVATRLTPIPVTPSPAFTNTPLGPTTIPILTMPAPITYYAASGGANIRSRPDLQGQQLIQIAAGQPIEVVGTARGEAVNGGPSLWYVVRWNGQTAYVYSQVVSANAPANPAPMVQPPAQQAPVVVQPISPAPAQQWVCTGDVYNCGNFQDRTTLMSYFLTCPGDPSKLDENGDGIPCESLR
ncbi:MAG: SH3 domain-containing protein [bacterium]|nr:SH3 domain-containing protein [bacterium]